MKLPLTGLCLISSISAKAPKNHINATEISSVCINITSIERDITNYALRTMSSKFKVENIEKQRILEIINRSMLFKALYSENLRSVNCSRIKSLRNLNYTLSTGQTCHYISNKDHMHDYLYELYNTYELMTLAEYKEFKYHYRNLTENHIYPEDKTWLSEISGKMTLFKRANRNVTFGFFNNNKVFLANCSMDIEIRYTQGKNIVVHNRAERQGFCKLSGNISYDAVLLHDDI